MFGKAALLLAFAATAFAVEYGHYQPQQHEEKYAEPNYSFHYEVKDDHTKDIKSHRESRKGDHTEGEYSLVEPDGTYRVVKYQVQGHSGFVAQVHRDGHNQHSYQNSYQQPQASYHSAPSYNAAPSYHSAPSYNAAPSYHSAPAPSYHSAPAPSYHSAPAPSYHSAPSYNSAPSYHQAQPSYQSGGHATSSASFSTHGAQVSTKTYHAQPAKYQGHY